MALTALVVLALTAGSPVSQPKTDDLPPPPMVFDFDPVAPAPTPPPVVTPVRPMVPPTPPRPAAPVVPEVIAPVGDGTLLGPIPFVEGGFGGVGLLVTPLNGTAAALSAVSVDVTHGAFSTGLGLVSGKSSTVGLTYFGPRAGYTFAHLDAFDFAAGVTLALGSANDAPAGGANTTTVVVWQPEVAVHARLVPWARAHATLGYRMVNAGTWSGPSGDKFSGLALGLGLDFGNYQ